MKKITPHLWFDKEAKEAADFYISIFPDSKITNVSTLHNTPSGDTDIVSFELLGYSFMAISAGPLFKFNPSISFMVNFDPSQDKDAKARIDAIWAKLSEGGKVLMPLDKYPFSERYGWLEDKYGLSWQLILTNPEGDERPLIIPSLLFVGNVCGKAEEASDFYLSVFKNSKRGAIARYGSGQAPDKEGTVMFTDFKLEDQWFAAMDSALMHDFAFNEAISFMVNCDTQEEIDYYWDKLSAVPEAEQCGWLKDKYGVSWQIVPTVMDEMMKAKDQKKIDRVTEAFLKMKKFDIAKLKEAYKGYKEKEKTMKELNFSVTINAPKEKVWKTMLGLESYKQWTNVSWPGSQYKGEWKKGTNIKFVGSDNQGGTLATIAELQPNEYILAKHIAVINPDGTEDRESEFAKGWIGSTESYTFTEKDSVTELAIKINTSPEWEEMFADGWPKALQALKELCER